MTRVKLLTLLTVLFALGCEDEFEFVNLSNNDVFVIGHGGSGFISPTNNIADNSMKSLEFAIEGLNADGVEVDLQLTRDSQLVFYHDNNLYTRTSCVQGRISSFNWNEIRDCKYKKNHFGSIAVSEGLVLMETAIKKFAQRKIKPQIHLDIRQNNFDPSQYNQDTFHDRFARKIVQLIEKYNAESWIFCGSQDIEFLKKVNLRNASIKLFLEGSNVNELLEKRSELPYFGIVISNDRITKEEVKWAHSKGVRVAIFNLKALPGNLDGLKKSPDYMITDNISLLQDIVK